MNHYAGYAHPIPGRRWWAMLRFARDAKPKPILGEGGSPLVFETELEALRAVNKHLLAYLNFPILGGETNAPSLKDARRQRAEKLFRGGGKVVEVERVRAEA